MQVFISGIGTDVGKTVVSALLCEAWNADYWKPVQSGSLEKPDREVVRDLLGREKRFFHPETYLLPYPLSPHASAALAGIEIDPEQFILPQTENRLVVEGAGGLMVPLGRKFLMLDLMCRLNIPVVLVSRHYLGSINHSLMSIELLRMRGLTLAGIVFVGEKNPSTEEVILESAGGVQKYLGRVPLVEKVDRVFVQKFAEQFREKNIWA